MTAAAANQRRILPVNRQLFPTVSTNQVQAPPPTNQSTLAAVPPSHPNQVQARPTTSQSIPAAHPMVFRGRPIPQRNPRGRRCDECGSNRHFRAACPALYPPVHLHAPRPRHRAPLNRSISGPAPYFIPRMDRPPPYIPTMMRPQFASGYGPPFQQQQQQSPMIPQLL
ncbi:MAG: hypothetical protein GY696_40585, partial [Gammaproteobacteria bacterium]|nr:hypothetical protein [Gammaproteobacteria bacterium]